MHGRKNFHWHFFGIVTGKLGVDIENAAQSADGIRDVAVELVWDPPWDMDRMGEAAKLELGLL